MPPVYHPGYIYRDQVSHSFKCWEYCTFRDLSRCKQLGLFFGWVDGDALILEMNSVGIVQDDPVVKICI